jgi:hypothetical protein
MEQDVSNSIPPTPDKDLRSLIGMCIGSGVAALVVEFVFEFYALKGVISMKYAWICLAIAWAIGVTGIVISEVVWFKGLRHRLITGVIASVILAVALLSINYGASRMVDNSPTTPQGDIVNTTITQDAKKSTASNVVSGRDSNVNNGAQQEKKHETSKTSAKPH